ncbi:MAG: hypothetical protein ACYS7Y_36415 [Planctomycetota bacterium]|jgi:hypothetical protein
MIDYKATFTNTDGVNFPNTKAVNVTTPGAGDGTEFIAAGVNDSWGWHQAMMAYAGLTPDTVTEAPGTSQMLEAMRLSFGHPGEVAMWHGQADPATLGLRLLLLEGQGILRANYPLLDAAVYIGDSNNGDVNFPFYYHATDAAGTSRSTTGIYLILADGRGVTIRGSDPTAIRDPFGAVRSFPDIQTDAVQSHGHSVFTASTGNYAEISTIPTAAGARSIFQPTLSPPADVLTADDSLTGGVKQDVDESRMINFSVKLCVRY